MNVITLDMSGVVQVSKDVIAGAPVFQGTRVPIQMLFDYLEGNETVDEFLNDFPSVSKGQVNRLLEKIKEQFLKATA